MVDRVTCYIVAATVAYYTFTIYSVPFVLAGAFIVDKLNTFFKAKQ